MHGGLPPGKGTREPPKVKPVGGGVSAFRELRAAPATASLRVLVLTPCDDEALVLAALGAGAERPGEPVGRRRRAVFAVFLGALMVPSIFTLLPNFVLVKQLHLIDTFLGVALPTMFMTPFAVFFLKQFFMNIPRELEEAALLDGASKVRVFFPLILPMAKAPISTLAILTYITAWNDYFWPLMVSYTDSSRVLTVALAVFKSQTPSARPHSARPLAPHPPEAWPGGRSLRPAGRTARDHPHRAPR